jgi:hypothetical protein
MAAKATTRFAWSIEMLMSSAYKGGFAEEG